MIARSGIPASKPVRDITRQERQVQQFARLEKLKLPADIDYETVPSLRIEARQKLSAIRPESIGQASRISGVSPSDVAVLLVYMEQRRQRKEHKDEV